MNFQRDHQEINDVSKKSLKNQWFLIFQWFLKRYMIFAMIWIVRRPDNQVNEKLHKIIIDDLALFLLDYENEGAMSRGGARRPTLSSIFLMEGLDVLP